MKKTNIILLLWIVMSSFPLMGQEPYDGRIEYRNLNKERHMHQGELKSVDISFTIDLGKMNLSKNQMVRIQPMLISADGQDTLHLSTYLVVGAKRDQVMRREIAFNGYSRYGQEVSVTKRDKSSNQAITAKHKVQYAPWIGSSRLIVHEDVTGCAGCKDGQHITQLVSRLFPAEHTPSYQFEYITPQVETVKRRAEKLEAFFNYKQGRSELLRDFAENASEFKRVDNFIQEILRDKNLTVSDYKVDGYASPEGDFKRNIALSKSRAQTFATYLKNTYGIAESKMKLDWHGEDWHGLRKAVLSSEISLRDDVARIIDEYDTDTKREAAINKLDNGKTFDLLLGQLYPKLRRNIFSVSYVVKSFDLNEAKQVYRTKPNQLSLQEFFQVANSYPQGSKDFIEVFRTALSFFPNDPIANLNCGAAELQAGNAMTAMKYLKKAGSLPEAQNNIGCALAMQRQFEEAQTQFEQAARAGNHKAMANKAEAKLVEETQL